MEVWTYENNKPVLVNVFTLRLAIVASKQITHDMHYCYPLHPHSV